MKSVTGSSWVIVHGLRLFMLPRTHVFMCCAVFRLHCDVYGAVNLPMGRLVSPLSTPVFALVARLIFT